MKNMQEDYPAIPPTPTEGSGSPTRGADTFDALQAPGAIAETLEIFQAERLLARAMDRPMIRRDGMDFGVVDDELGYMAEPEGMKHVSTTLLVPGERVSVYKPFGFLVDAERAEIEHVSEHDSGSNTDNEGNLKTNESDLATLDELAQRIHESSTRDMNEVNATLPTDAVRGLFATNYYLPKLDALVTQHHVQRQGKGTLPIFLYDQDRGSLLPWEPSTEEIAKLLDTIGSERMRNLYSNLALARSVGSTAVTASQ